MNLSRETYGQRGSLTIKKCARLYRVSPMAVTLNQLSSFLAVAREGSVSAAAEKLYVTQPSISAAVSSLSKELGVELTERVGRGIGLTAAGEAFLPYAADVLGLVQQGKQAAREASDSSMRSLSIVAVATAAEYVVPSLLRTFTAQHPEIKLSLEVANRATLFDLVLEHRGRCRGRGPPAGGRADRGPRLPEKRAGADHRARRSAHRRPCCRAGGACRSSVAPTRGGFWHAAARLPVSERARPRVRKR